MSEIIQHLCHQCRYASVWTDDALCFECQTVREWSDVNRLFCALLHRGAPLGPRVPEEGPPWVAVTP